MIQKGNPIGEFHFEVLQHIKKKMPATRFIALSADPGDEACVEALGADAFPAKPFLLSDLFNIVQRFVVDDNQSSR